MNKKITSLQIIRAFAFLGIFACHSGLSVFSGCGAWGVSIFIILSGFLMFYSYGFTDRLNNISITNSIIFGLRKIGKLYPLHLLTLLLALPFLVNNYSSLLGASRYVRPILVFILNLTLLQSWLPNMEYYFSLNAVAWYLSVALFHYIVFPYIRNIIRKYKSKRDAIIVIICVFTLQFLMTYFSHFMYVRFIDNNYFVHWIVYIFPLSRLTDFVIGCNLGYIFCVTTSNNSKHEKHACYTVWEICILLLILLQLALYFFIIYVPSRGDPIIIYNYWWSLTIYWTVTSCSLIYLFALNKGKLSQLLSSNRALIFIGNMSANAFLIHQIIYRYLDIFEYKFRGKTYNFFNLIMCFVITMICSFVAEYVLKHFRYTRLLQKGYLKNYEE